MKSISGRLGVITFLLFSLLFSAYGADMSAPPNSLVVGDTGNVGIGTPSPTSSLHVKFPDNAKLVVENTNTDISVVGGERFLFNLKNNGKTRFAITAATVTWTFDNDGGGFSISKLGTGVNEFRINNAGNLTILGALTEGSSRKLKTNIEDVDSAEILKKVVNLPIKRWSYLKAADTAHLGPMSEDFHGAFGLGDNPQGISTLDTGGVSLAAIKGLYQLVEERDEVIERQQSDLTEMQQLREKDQALLARLERRVLDLEARLGNSHE